VRVRLDRKATAISLLVVIGVRADGQKVVLAVKAMGSESTEAWRALLDDLIRRGLRRPECGFRDDAAHRSEMMRPPFRDDLAHHSGMISPGVWCLCWPTQVRSFDSPKEDRMPAERTTMRHVREIVRLKFFGGVPIREIARRVGVAPSTVRTTLERAEAAGLNWPLPEELTDAALEAKLFVDAGSKLGHRRQAEPDWASIHRELKRKHVTL
jgi:transposase-like protein